LPPGAAVFVFDISRPVSFWPFWLFARQSGKTWGMQEILFQLKKDGDGAFLG
jgi:hypothetical protein